MRIILRGYDDQGTELFQEQEFSGDYAADSACSFLGRYKRHRAEPPSRADLTEGRHVEGRPEQPDLPGRGDEVSGHGDAPPGRGKAHGRGGSKHKGEGDQ